jgi:hypothetical protein
MNPSIQTAQRQDGKRTRPDDSCSSPSRKAMYSNQGGTVCTKSFVLSARSDLRVKEEDEAQTQHHGQVESRVSFIIPCLLRRRTSVPRF